MLLINQDHLITVCLSNYGTAVAVCTIWRVRKKQNGQELYKLPAKHWNICELFSFSRELWCNTKGKCLVCHRMQFQARVVHRGGRSTAIHLSELAPLREMQHSPSGQPCELRALAAPGSSHSSVQLLGFSFSWDTRGAPGAAPSPPSAAFPAQGVSAWLSAMGTPLHAREWVKTLPIWLLHPFLLQTPCQPLLVLNFPL